MNKLHPFIPALPLLLLLVLSSCSTRKNTFPNRAYHTVTAAFNVNFNGKEALKAGEAELEKKNKDNYTAILPVYYYPAKNDISSIYPTMDKAIEKSSKAIYKHSMMFRGVEHVRPIEKSYMVMGKAYFHKQDYVQSQRIFTYVTNTYKGKKWKCREEAMIWGARSSLRQNYYSTALTSLNEIEHALYKNSNKKLKMLYNAAAAEYHLTAPDGEIETAIDHLHQAIKYKPNRAFKTRLYFILGQLYESTDHLPEAQKYFQQVIKRTPPYEMEFSAHMHLATNYDGSDASRTAILRNLNRMLDERKNEDYRDQIYYAIAKIAEKDEDEEEVIRNLALSVAAYTNNDYQRTYSSIKLADILFEDEQYIEAQTYYDTALLSLPNNYPNRESIINKANTLRGLVDNLNTITLQDSLQRIAKMPERQRNAWVSKMIADYTEAERKAAKEEADRMAAYMSTAHMANTTITTSSNKWYFYNQALVTAGKTDFYRLWGNRKLEDNWRISNKQQISFDDLAFMNDPTLAQDTLEYDDDGNPVKVRETDPKKPEYYTQDLPLTPEAMDSSNMMVANALYNAAIIYLDQLQDVKRSNETFEKLIRRFPAHELTLPALYMLYRNYYTTNNPKADEPKNIILTQYPESDYARLIQDPDFYKRLAEKEKELENKYDVTYDAFSQKQWQRTIQLSNEAIPVCLDPELKSKYEYIRAVAIGQVKGEDSLKSHLVKIISQYPGTPVGDLAVTHLSLFSEVPKSGTPAGTSEGTSSTSRQQEETPYAYAPNEMHYIIFIIDATKLAVLDVKNDISTFNNQFYSLQKFNINSFYINQNEQMVTVARFKNKETAMDYYHAISKNELFLPSIINSSITLFPISATNYTSYYNNVSKRPLYKEFFQTHYSD